MARSRNIKPGLFKNELLGEADPIYSLLFVGLWTIADKDGRLECRPKRIRAEVFPYRFNVDVSLALAWLNDNSFITVYEIDGNSYIQINNWKKHQTPHHKEVDSEIPPPPKTKKPQLKQEVAQAQAKHESTLSQDKAKQNASCPTDSLNLIPDSLNLIPDSLNLIPDSGGEVITSPVNENKIVDRSGEADQIDILGDQPPDQPKPKPCPHSEIISLYHDMLPELQRVQPKLWTQSQSAKHLQARWKQAPEHQSLEFWTWFFAGIKKIPWYLGQNDRGWRANLHWLVKRENFIKAIERITSN